MSEYNPKRRSEHVRNSPSFYRNTTLEGTTVDRQLHFAGVHNPRMKRTKTAPQRRTKATALHQYSEDIPIPHGGKRLTDFNKVEKVTIRLNARKPLTVQWETKEDLLSTDWFRNGKDFEKFIRGNPEAKLLRVHQTETFGMGSKVGKTLFDRAANPVSFKNVYVTEATPPQGRAIPQTIEDIIAALQNPPAKLLAIERSDGEELTIRLFFASDHQDLDTFAYEICRAVLKYREDIEDCTYALGKERGKPVIDLYPIYRR